MTLNTDLEYDLGMIMVVNEHIKLVMFSRTINELKYNWLG